MVLEDLKDVQLGPDFLQTGLIQNSWGTLICGLKGSKEEKGSALQAVGSQDEMVLSRGGECLPVLCSILAPSWAHYSCEPDSAIVALTPLNLP